MSVAVAPTPLTTNNPFPVPFAAAALALAVAAAALAGWVPIQFSFLTVFLFAGPHNWLEARYFLTRMPGRWGKLRGFFLFAFGGLFVLTATFIGLRWFVPFSFWEYTDFHSVLAGWNTLL